MYYGTIKKYDIANGPGVRVSLFVSGCRHHCKGCFNAETWDFRYGQLYTEETEKEILAALEPGYIQGFTLLGGEPFEPENQVELVHLLQKVRETYPEKDIWCYSGYLWDRDLAAGGVEPIVWRVLSVEDGRAYLLSEYVLEARPIHSDYQEYANKPTNKKKPGFNGDFTQTEMSRYLCGDFAQNCFTDDERAMLTPDDTFGLFTSPASDADLKNKAYGFTSNESRKAWGTPYALANGLFEVPAVSAAVTPPTGRAPVLLRRPPRAAHQVQGRVGAHQRHHAGRGNAPRMLSVLERERDFRRHRARWMIPTLSPLSRRR